MRYLAIKPEQTEQRQSWVGKSQLAIADHPEATKTVPDTFCIFLLYFLTILSTLIRTDQVWIDQRASEAT
ncbi:MAG: hypothetical protein R3C20_25315 [Planctomycetaceae bacterium]